MAKTIIHNENGDAKWGEEDHLQVAKSRSFSSLVFELLSEKAPTEAELKVFELILNLSIDHGPDTPSAKEVISEKGKGKSISEAVAAGVMQINDTHGGAQEKLMEVLYRVKRASPTSSEQESRVKEIVSESLGSGQRIPGFGHRIYKDTDPRAQLILGKLGELGFSDEFIKIAQDLEAELESQKGNKLPLNIDGAIAVVLCTLGWDPKLGKAVFIVARTPGLCGQYLNNS